MKKIILTMLAGKYQMLKPLVFPLLQHYSKKCKADLYCIEEYTNQDVPHMEKFEIFGLLSKYDRLLYIDGDMLVRPDCPNLFSLVPNNYFAAYDEVSEMWDYDDIHMRINDVNQLAILNNLPLIPYPEINDFHLSPVFYSDKNIPIKYFNAGMFLLGKKHKSIFKKIDLKMTKFKFWTDQSYINWYLQHNKIPTYDLPVCFNQMPHNRYKNYQTSSFILHYAGVPGIENRLQAMQLDLKAWQEQGFFEKYV